VIDLTEQQIADAKANDLEAVTAVVKATEARVQQLAWRYASNNGRTDLDLLDDLAQIGRIAVWEGIARFAGRTVAEFFSFIDGTIQGVMTNARKTETRPGVSRAVAAEFERALSVAGGDVYEAERMVTQTEVMGARRLSPEMAHAARLSYQGVEYLDAPVKTGDHGLTLADWLAASLEMPTELLESSDFERARRNATRDKVHGVLNMMGKQQRTVLKALTGIEPVGYYGTENDEELASDYGYPPKRIKIARSEGKKQFAALWEVVGA